MTAAGGPAHRQRVSDRTKPRRSPARWDGTALALASRLDEADWVGAEFARRGALTSPTALHSTLSATVGAVSARSVRGPRCSNRAPAYTACDDFGLGPAAFGPDQQQRVGRWRLVE